MLPRLAQWILGDSWRTSLASLSAAVLYGAQSVPALLDGTATASDWRRAGVAAALYLIGRFSADIPRQPKEDSTHDR